MSTALNESFDQMVSALLRPTGRDARFADPSYRAELAQVTESIIAPAFRGDTIAKAAFHKAMGGTRLHEAMSTSDFPILFGDFLYRSLARRYAAFPSVWQKFAARKVNKDFRATKLIDLLGGSTILDDVDELAPYPIRALAETEIEMKTGKTGAVLEWSWEMGVNDDLGAFRDAPNRLARAARYTEDFKATSAVVTPTGPAAWLGTPGNVPLTPENLQAAIAQITNQVDEDGNPIIIDTPVLMVPRALTLTAQQIVDTVTVKTTANNKEREVRGNGLQVTPEIVTNPWIEKIDKSNKVATTWYLLAGPDSDRPAVFEVFLEGNETPDLRVRADAGQRLGGGNVDPAEGSFDNDGVQYRVRHVVAGSRGFDEVVYASTGS